MTRQKAPHRYASKTRLSIRRTDSGSAGCYVTVAVRGKQEFIIAELDSEIRKIRLKLTDSYEEGVRLSSGTFTLPARFCREILPDDVRSITILLEKSEDDWWYGSYLYITDAFALLSCPTPETGKSKFSPLPAFSVLFNEWHKTLVPPGDGTHI